MIKDKKKILVVEDDKLLLQVLKEYLELEDFKVEITINGLDAIKKIKDFKPDLILLDLILPGKDGFSILKELKTDSKTNKIPIVILSNLEKPEDVKAAEVLKAKQYILKSKTNLKEVVKIIKKNIK